MRALTVRDVVFRYGQEMREHRLHVVDDAIVMRCGLKMLYNALDLLLVGQIK